MSVAELTAHAEQMRELRQTNAALQCALERVTSERDQWRIQCNELQFRHAQFMQAIHRLCKESSNG